ncbi:MAG: M3 family metallopeptidase [Xanthomonadales bacterium]|nr:M3 family metallopeptidase [Xanthomonadales bacterium]
MSTDNPLLDTDSLPDFAIIRPAQINPAIDDILTGYREAVANVCAPATPRDFAHVIAPLEDWSDRLSGTFSPASHLHGVADSPALREAYNAAIEKLTGHATELGQNRELYAAVRAVAESDEFTALDAAQRTLIEDRLRDFRLSGVALEEPARSRFRAIQTELSKLETGFEEAVLDATEAWTRPVSESELVGLPEQARRMLRQSAKAADKDGWLASLKPPVVQAILTYADDRELRADVYRAYNTRASDQGPNGGQFDNGPRIEQIMALRHESATLLGFANAAELSLADKMAGTPERVIGFLEDLAAKAKPVAERELGELRAFAQNELGLDNLQPWDVPWASEKRRQKLFDFSEEDVKPYFPLQAALDGLFAVAERIFGVTLQQRDGVSVWHDDVRYFDVIDADGSVRAGVYIDLYARSGKRGGAWMDVCRNRRDAEGRLPVAYVTCNFPPPGDDAPSLLSHDEVLTLFHEFGHGLHHMLTEVTWPSVCGIAGVEWDAVELPSQFMENFGWERAALDLFAKHWQNGELLPQALFDKMQAARHFHVGLFLVRQLEFALFDFRLHRDYDPDRGARTLETLDDVREQVAVIRPPDWHRFPQAFTHIFAGGYAAGYFSYLWAEVLSADAFAAFEEAGIFDINTGRRFREQILAVGGSRPALESFVAFRGREPEPDALLRSYGLAA